MAAETPSIKTGTSVGPGALGKPVHFLKQQVIMTPATADAADTIAVTLANYGITTFLGIHGWKETTDGSVVVTENPTTAVSAGVLTITIPAGTDNDPRTYLIYGE